MTSMITCPGCKNTVSSEASFCYRCGASLAGNPPATAGPSGEVLKKAETLADGLRFAAAAIAALGLIGAFLMGNSGGAWGLALAVAGASVVQAMVVAFFARTLDLLRVIATKP